MTALIGQMHHWLLTAFPPIQYQLAFHIYQNNFRYNKVILLTQVTYNSFIVNLSLINLFLVNLFANLTSSI